MKSNISCIPNGAIMSASSAPGAPAGKNARNMKRKTRKSSDPDLRPDYDFSRGVRGKYARRYVQGANVVVLSRTWPRPFPTPPP